jgi:hypothetical protein
MPEVQQCTKCGRIIESGEVFVRFGNPNQPPLSFTIAACAYQVRLGGIVLTDVLFCALSSSAARRCLSGATSEC